MGDIYTSIYINTVRKVHIFIILENVSFSWIFVNEIQTENFMRIFIISRFLVDVTLPGSTAEWRAFLQVPVYIEDTAHMASIISFYLGHC